MIQKSLKEVAALDYLPEHKISINHISNIYPIVNIC